MANSLHDFRLILMGLVEVFTPSILNSGESYEEDIKFGFGRQP